MPNDPRSKYVPGVEIPNRPAGQRPATASPPDVSNFTNIVLGMLNGFVPMLHGFSNASGFGDTPRYQFGNADSFHGTSDHVCRETGQAHQANDGLHADKTLKKLLLFIFVLAVLALFLL
ncbi:unnamed protein product [Fraxinus pennsylvanica]|uniref:Uncharacterized protein n=1 Tax=Fraxinus pennsylvanica TaxID=56036 RepID=A0AAD1YTK4_9LAMI|nr:unnamed protein product [Fraxinus pennsylvanica]